MGLKKKGIIAYGDPEDRAKLAALAQATGCSGSEWIVQQIRDKFRESFGETEPSLITASLS